MNVTVVAYRLIAIITVKKGIGNESNFSAKK